MLQEITSLVEQRLESNQKELKTLFKASKVEKHIYHFSLLDLIRHATDYLETNFEVKQKINLPILDSIYFHKCFA